MSRIIVTSLLKNSAAIANQAGCCQPDVEFDGGVAPLKGAKRQERVQKDTKQRRRSSPRGSWHSRRYRVDTPVVAVWIGCRVYGVSGVYGTVADATLPRALLFSYSTSSSHDHIYLITEPHQKTDPRFFVICYERIMLINKDVQFPIVGSIKL